MIQMSRQYVPRKKSDIVRSGDSEGLDLMMDEAELFCVVQILPVSGIDIVNISRIPLHNRYSQGTNGQSVDQPTCRQAPECLSEEIVECHLGEGTSALKSRQSNLHTYH